MGIIIFSFFFYLFPIKNDKKTLVRGWFSLETESYSLSEVHIAMGPMCSNVNQTEGVGDTDSALTSDQTPLFFAAKNRDA